jgi:hypothetical protein
MQKQGDSYRSSNFLISISKRRPALFDVFRHNRHEVIGFPSDLELGNKVRVPKANPRGSFLHVRGLDPLASGEVHLYTSVYIKVARTGGGVFCSVSASRLWRLGQFIGIDGRCEKHNAMVPLARLACCNFRHIRMSLS